MSDHTGIEWTDATWNPVTGCTTVSPGCDRCYARTFAERWRGVPGHHFTTGFDLTLREDKLVLPLRWRRPRRVFGRVGPAGGLHWVIAGGESGPGARPMSAEWVRTLRDQCTAAGTAFLFKQWGGRTPKTGGRELDGHTHDEFPTAPRSAA